MTYRVLFVYRKSTKKTKDTATYAGTSAAGGVVTTLSPPPRSKLPAPASANSLKALDAKMTHCASNHLGMVSLFLKSYFQLLFPHTRAIRLTRVFCSTRTADLRRNRVV